jgi:heme A synthase
VWAFRAYPRGHRVRRGATLSLFFIITEALVGAGLVLFQLVAHDESVYRAVSIAIHLVNTFLLLMALTLTAWWASGGAPLQLRGQGLLGWALGLALLGTLALGVTGAITALGDTLFPARSLAEGVQQDFAATANFLVRLRFIHPIVAVTLGLYVTALSWIVSRHRPGTLTERLAWVLTGLFLAQLCVGALNVGLLAPVWLQIVHLLMADAVWIALVLFSAAAFAWPAELAEAERAPSTAPRPARSA